MRTTANRQEQRPEEVDDLEPDGLSVALFDDHELMRRTIASNLASVPGLDVVASGSSADEAIASAEALIPQVIILDVNMPGGGLSAARKINVAFPAIKIVMLTSDDSEHLVSSALRAGASAYVVKGSPLRELVETVKAVARGHSYISPGLSGKILSPRSLGTPWRADDQEPPFAILDREEQILRRLAQGLTMVEIGEGIGLSETTVAKYLTNILMKLQADVRSKGEDVSDLS